MHDRLYIVSLAPSASSSAFNDIDAFVVVVDRARETLTLSAPLSSDNGGEQASLKPTWYVVVAIVESGVDGAPFQSITLPHTYSDAINLT